MRYAVFLKISEASYSRFEAIRMQLNAGIKSSQSKLLGQLLSEIACEIIEQAFSELLWQQLHKAQGPEKREVQESQKIIQQVLDNVRKYMPWSVSLFSNERLLPLVNYLAGLISEHERQIYIRYEVNMPLVEEVFKTVEQLRGGQWSAMTQAFRLLVRVVDLGVTSLIREPKKLLGFNKIIDKTLNGVINVTAHMGYKRLEKVGTQLQQEQAHDYIEHFLAFMQPA